MKSSFSTDMARSSFRFPVFSAYEIVGNGDQRMIRPTHEATIGGRYAPLHHPHVLFAFAGLYREEEPNLVERELLEFVHRWGLLGLGVHAERDLARMRRMKQGENLILLKLRLIRAHEAIDHSYSFRQWDDVIQRTRAKLEPASRRPRLFSDEPKSREYLAHLAAFINEEFSVIPYEFGLDEAENLTKGPLILTPLQAIFYYLADVLTGTITVKQCKAPDCGKFFQVTDQRMRFCPSPRSPLNPKAAGESRCAARVRNAAARKKRRNRTFAVLA